MTAQAIKVGGGGGADGGAGHDIKDFQDLSTGQLEQKFYLSRWLIDLSTLWKSVYYILNSMCICQKMNLSTGQLADQIHLSGGSSTCPGQQDNN